MLIMAPMSGCTDLPFRTIIKDFGCRFAFYEMLDASATLYSHKKTAFMLQSAIREMPLGAQILGSDPSMVLDAAQIILSQAKPVLIDLNCACPAKKVIKKKAGAYLLKEPKKAAKIIKNLSSRLPVPVTVKVRSGWDKNFPQQGLKLAKIARDNGAKAVFMHGRTVRQGYEGHVEYLSIARTKEVLDIPVIASGDIWNPRLAEKMLIQTGCDGLLVARGALGRPWIFKEIQAHLEGKKIPAAPSLGKIKILVKRHLKAYADWKSCPQKYIIGHMRKIAMWYFRGKVYATRTRDAIAKAQAYEEICEIIDRVT
ncbi:MAG: tRNA dihydrouridine synthase DusB [Candidatus Omnitrophica bacterium]|nr:tRNA dihydrouridine synthase DusB [Candidatus Omnitrophota bacterium]